MSLGKDEQRTSKFEDNKRYKTHDYLIDFGLYNDVYKKKWRKQISDECKLLRQSILV